MQGIHPPQPQPTPHTQAVQRAAQAADAHATHPDTTTLHTLHTAVQDALNTGATFADIRAARTQAATA